jgi:phenylacetate-CoA ligase
MKSLETIRKYGFWGLDFLKGGKIRKHLRSISSVMNNASKNKADQQRDKDLLAILKHATTTTKFYRDKTRFKSLSDFSVINKSIVRDAMNSFYSNAFELSELVSVVTSGSTGTPFKVYHNKDKKLRNSADTIYFSERAGYTIGSRLIYMKIFVPGKMKNPISYLMENTIPIDVIKLDDAEIAALINLMENDRSTFSIVGYSSALSLLCKYLEKKAHGTVKADIKSIIAISEALDDHTKQKLHEYFGSPVISRYSNLENGIIAQQEIGESGKFIINTASYYVEILEINSDRPAGAGKTGRIVVTDLFNYGMPLIRYDTGDVGILSADSNNSMNMYLEKVEGRKLDILYDTGGNIVSSYLVYKNMWQYTEINQYQLIQEGPKEYTFKINSDVIFTKEAKLISEFKKYLGQDAVFKLVYVSEIPLLSSGKRKFIVNQFSANHPLIS